MTNIAGTIIPVTELFQVSMIMIIIMIMNNITECLYADGKNVLQKTSRIL